jgi:hypothetical protein
VAYLMTLTPIFRRSLLAAAGLALLFLAWNGLSGGVNQLPESDTSGQIAQTLSQFAFGLFSLLSLLTSFWGRRWNRLMLAGFTISVGLAAGLASVVWGGTSLTIGFLSGSAALAVALAIAWLLRIGARGFTRV